MVRVMFYPSREEIKKAAESRKYKTAPVSMEILSDIKTPMEVLRILKNVSEHCYMLESISDNEKCELSRLMDFCP